MTEHDSSHPPRRNQLADMASAYLRSAAGQPIHWFPWGEAAFDAARNENKPILLDIGAVWCHWCHVMDRESYENEAIAALINEHYIAIKLDRDERPDIDARYQSAIGAITGQGGWPLTGFLTPDGRVFYGGTYFPPEDRHGRPGLRRILEALAETYRAEPGKVEDQAHRIMETVAASLERTDEPAPVSERLLSQGLTSLIADFDEIHGGFGNAPKFPHPTAVELLLAQHAVDRDPRPLTIVQTTLRRMAEGGIYDQLGGGFHRYSTDDRWIVPHFEKMLSDNALLAENYIHAFQATGDQWFKSVAEDILRFVRSTLTDGSRGGFYASQDADVSADDDGSYFTWTLNELSGLLSGGELEAARLRYHIGERGEMHHDPTQNVLFIDADEAEIATRLQWTPEMTRQALDRVRAVMRSARERRPTPFIDPSVYASWNAMMISAFLSAYKAWGSSDDLNLAIRSLARIVREHSGPDGVVTHAEMSRGNVGLLDDHVELATALVLAFEVTGDPAHLVHARAIVERTIRDFFDDEHGGFFDVPRGRSEIGTALRLKPLVDSAGRSPNAVAIRLLLRLWRMGQGDHYRAIAERTLSTFAGNEPGLGLHHAAYLHAVQEYLREPPHALILGDPADAIARRLHHAAMRAYCPGASVSLIAPADRSTLPEYIREAASRLEPPLALVCSGTVCSAPIADPDQLSARIESFGTERPPL